MRLLSLLRTWWNDDCGAIISAEYLLVGTAGTLAAVVGLSAMREAVVDEMHEMATTVRSARQTMAPARQTLTQAPTVVPASAPAGVLNVAP